VRAPEGIRPRIAGQARRQRPSFVGAVVLVVIGPLAGCLESTPPPVHPYVSDATAFPPADAGRDGDAGAREVDPAAPLADGGAENWAGKWTFTSGSTGVNCGGAISVQASEGFLVITPNATGDGLTVRVGGCSFHFALAGDTATTDPPEQSCANWAIPVIPVWTLTMKPDGTLEEKLGGQVSMSGESCTLFGKSTLTRE